jgi:hypothetical protein
VHAGGLVTNSAITSQVTPTGAKTAATTGTYTVTWGTAHPKNQSYTVVATAINTWHYDECKIGKAHNSTTVTFYVRDYTNALVNAAFNFIVY